MIEVTHSQGKYPIIFEPLQNALGSLPEDSFVVTDENVAQHYKTTNQKTLTLPPGEQTKSLIWLERIAAWLANQGASRKSTVVALGGGVIGDLVGFAAATYMRGVPYIQIPTTLLAQVDSSVGGKVAVDIPEGKNLVGAFHAPIKVSIDPGTLTTLSKRQLRNGMAEVWKYAFIMDPELLAKLKTHPDDLKPIIQTCIEHKAKIVREDEFETEGIRAILNYGHTIGHALEQATGYRKLLHGEAISIGMVIEAHLGEQLGITQRGTVDEVAQCLQAEGLPTSYKEPLPPEELIEVMKRDKKASRGNLTFSLLTQIGGCKLVENVPQNEVLHALKKL
ncbi:MAG: 3-dehydroquinate synthase [Fimbriimonas sp.]